MSGKWRLDATALEDEKQREPHLIHKYRNPSAHPKPFNQELLSHLRWELFGEDVLRDILECLAPPVG